MILQQYYLRKKDKIDKNKYIGQSSKDSIDTCLQRNNDPQLLGKILMPRILVLYR